MPEPLAVNPRATAETIGYYGFRGEEWVGADGERYRTNGAGCGVFRVADGIPVPGLEVVWVGPYPERWADEINAACDQRDDAEGTCAS